MYMNINTNFMQNNILAFILNFNIKIREFSQSHNSLIAPTNQYSHILQYTKCQPTFQHSPQDMQKAFNIV